MTRISKSLKGENVFWIAREGRKVVARAESEDKLDTLLEERAANMAVRPPVEEEESQDERQPEERGKKLRFRKSKE